MITLNALQRQAIRDRIREKEWIDVVQSEAAINETLAELNRDDRLTPPEPITRTATMTILDDGSHLLVLRNGDCIAAVTMTAAQVIAWEFREASR